MNTYALAQALNRRGLSGTAGVVVGAMISIIVIVAMAIPVTQNVITNQGFTGTLKTVTDLIPLFLGLAALITVAALFS
jgi:hypothetical protein